MRVVIQRVLDAAVSAEGYDTQSIDMGLLIYTGVGQGDTADDLAKMARKVINMRLFEDDKGKFDRSVLEVGGAILVIPQFTLFANADKGRRPTFFDAAPPTISEPMFHKFCDILCDNGIETVRKGMFGQKMIVTSRNLGPVTIPLFLE